MGDKNLASKLQNTGWDNLDKTVQKPHSPLLQHTKGHSAKLLPNTNVDEKHNAG